MADTKTLDAVLRKLRRANCFTAVERADYWEDTKEAEFSAEVDPRLSPAYVAGVKALVAKRGRSVADNELETVMKDLLVERLRLDFPLTVEFGSDYDFDPDNPGMPETVTVIVDMTQESSRAPKASLGKTNRAGGGKGLSRTLDHSSLPAEERKKAVGRTEERERSRRRREKTRTTKILAGQEVRVGRLGYIRQVRDPNSGRLIWAPTQAGERVMREMDKVWLITVFTGAALARHLNSVPGLKTLDGKRFTRNMMTDLLRHLDRLRRSRAF